MNIKSLWIIFQVAFSQISKMQKNYLITTNIEKKFIGKNKRFYLADWCLDENELKKNKSKNAIKLNKYSTYLQS